MKIPVIHRPRDIRDVVFEKKTKNMARASGLPVWYVRNLMRWRLKRALPVYTLVTSAPIKVPARLYALAGGNPRPEQV